MAGSLENLSRSSLDLNTNIRSLEPRMLVAGVTSAFLIHNMAKIVTGSFNSEDLKLIESSFKKGISPPRSFSCVHGDLEERPCRKINMTESGSIEDPVFYDLEDISFFKSTRNTNPDAILKDLDWLQKKRLNILKSHKQFLLLLHTVSDQLTPYSSVLSIERTSGLGEKLVFDPINFVLNYLYLLVPGSVPYFLYDYSLEEIFHLRETLIREDKLDLKSVIDLLDNYEKNNLRKSSPQTHSLTFLQQLIGYDEQILQLISTLETSIRQDLDRDFRPNVFITYHSSLEMMRNHYS